MKKWFPLTLAGILGCIQPLAAADSWPQWLGPNRDGTLAAGVAVPESIPAELKSSWRIQIGGGFSSPVVVGQALIYLDDKSGQETAHRVDTRTGQEEWAVPLAATFQDEWGAGTRSTPCIDTGRVYALSCNGEFRCLDLRDGKTIWGKNFEKDFGVKFLGSKSNEGTSTRRGNNGSALVSGDFAYVPVGSTNGAMLVKISIKATAPLSGIPARTKRLIPLRCWQNWRGSSSLFT